ncbi:MAG TPA: amylo-alpha-1,6-glucosidase [Pyrinomonadaceae bacterium]|nr:amylo-alpha-1,6-glucosidase [Pyrinomonadaceae bacterium]
MIQYHRDTIQDLSTSLSREWLETNGLGGFASSTITGLNTRRYHGLLTAATKPPVGRILLLSKLEETLVIDDRCYQLSANEYSGAIHPRGFIYQTGFKLDPWPVFSYEMEGVRLEKSVLMVHGQNTTVIDYECHSAGLDPAQRIKLEVRPLIAFRDYHSTTHENSALNAHVEREDGITSVQPYQDLPWLHLAHDCAELDRESFWYRSFEYAVERERGLDFAEDLFSPFSLTFDLDRFSRARIIASTERHDIRDADSYREAETNRRDAIANSTHEDDLLESLTAAADQYVVARGGQKTIIAGYHWFSDWGRDTMIALPGLTLVTKRPEIARSILAEFAKHVDRGMLPNRFPDAGETPEYNTVDATLWFFEAVRSLVHYANDYDFVRDNLYATLKEIVSWHIQGTRYNIHVDTDGLLYSGEPGVQLTWMDAKVGDWVVTPRHGKPVEIQALWFNALRLMQHLAARFVEPDNVQQYGELAARAEASFNEQFWNEATGCLYDVVNGDQRDGSIRPNQIIAVALTHSMVSQERAASVLRVVERDLLTSRGLRTLSPDDPQYRPRYEGDSLSRDGAYHQGTVWPWLMGPYMTAYSKTFGEEAGREFGARWLSNFRQHLEEACIGHVSEIFDAEEPHRPRGCVAQAWSVAELLRAAVEDVYASPGRKATAAATTKS